MKLMFASMGNGVTVCDGERKYETVCHISVHGHVKYYVEKDHIPPECLDAIANTAKQERQAFMEEWNHKSPAGKYAYMMNVPTIGCGYNAFTKVAKENWNLPIAEQVHKMEPVFFNTHL